MVHSENLALWKDGKRKLLLKGTRKKFSLKSVRLNVWGIASMLKKVFWLCSPDAIGLLCVVENNAHPIVLSMKHEGLQLIALGELSLRREAGQSYQEVV